MAIIPLTDDLNIIQALGDRPNDDGLTADQLKAKFDEGPGKIKTYLNNTVYNALRALETDTHTHSNKATLDGVTAAYTAEEKTKLAGIAAGATNVTVDQTYDGTGVNPPSGAAIEAVFEHKVKAACADTYDPAGDAPVNGCAVADAITSSYNASGTLAANGLAVAAALATIKPALLWDYQQQGGGSRLTPGGVASIPGIEDWFLLLVCNDEWKLFAVPNDSGYWTGGDVVYYNSGTYVLYGDGTIGTGTFALINYAYRPWSGSANSSAVKRIYGLIRKSDVLEVS